MKKNMNREARREAREERRAARAEKREARRLRYQLRREARALKRRARKGELVFAPTASATETAIPETAVTAVTEAAKDANLAVGLTEAEVKDIIREELAAFIKAVMAEDEEDDEIELVEGELVEDEDEECSMSTSDEIIEGTLIAGALPCFNAMVKVS